MYDVCNNVMLGAELSALEIGEGCHAEQLLSHAVAGDVVLYDRGYPSFYLSSLHNKRDTDYCMRTPIGRCKSVLLNLLQVVPLSSRSILSSVIRLGRTVYTTSCPLILFEYDSFESNCREVMWRC